MAKALELSEDTLAVVPAVPKAAKRPELAPAPRPKAATIPREPLQVRWPAEEVKAVKLAALKRDLTVSDFMLACFHASMKDVK